MNRCLLLIIVFMLISTDVFAGDMRVYGHSTGSVTLVFDAVYPLIVYKSIDNANWVLMAQIQQGEYTEYGLSNGVTYYYKVVDNNGLIIQNRYTPPYVNIQILPLQVVQIDDDIVHLKWDMYEYEKDLYQNGLKIQSGLTCNEFTVNELQPDTEYEFYTIDVVGNRSNTIIVRTSVKMMKLEKLLREIFEPTAYVDTDGDGLRDELEPLNDKLNEMQDKVGLGVVRDVKDSIDSLDTNGFNEDLSAIPVIRIEYMGIDADLFNLDVQEFSSQIIFIRYLVLAFMVCGFIMSILSIFNITFKV